MLRTLVSNLVLVSGIGSSVLVLVDWFLSKRQKEHMRDLATKVWYWLSIQTSETYLVA